METDSPLVAQQRPSPSLSKYGNLPDVDISAPDLYESGQGKDTLRSKDPTRRKTRKEEGDDEEDSSDSANDSDDPAFVLRKHKGVNPADAVNNDIDSNSLSRTSAAAKFGRATELNDARADFSGRVAVPRVRTATRSTARPKDAGFETDVYSLGSRRQESVVDRLRQLKYEANLLEEELASQPAVSQSASEQDTSVTSRALLSQLHSLQTRLSELDSRAGVGAPVEGSGQDLNLLVQQLSQPSTAASSDVKALQKDQQAPTKNADVALLDARLSDLEAVVGFQEGGHGDDAVQRPLLSTLSRLESQLALLSQPRHLDTISRRVKVLVTEMDRVRDVRENLTAQAGEQTSSRGDKTPLTSSDVDQLQHLFQVANRLEPLLPIVPPVLNRLQTLGDLHASAAQFKTSLDGLQAKTEAQHQQTSELQQLLESMEVNMDQNRTTMQTNLEALQARIMEVSHTLQGLQ